MTPSKTRTIQIDALTRVEGEGALEVRIENDQVTDVRLAIYEPPRLFESLLRGRKIEDVPDITARICGICPVAYQMTAVHALEQALGVRVSSPIRDLRRLLYCGEWIESHGVHMHLLHLPDFFDCANSIELAKRYPNEINRGLQMRKTGNRLLEVLGGRAIHPVNVAVGGFFRLPARDELTSLLPELEWGLKASIDTTRWVRSFTFPEFRQDYEMVALVHPDEYPLNEGRIASTSGLNLDVVDYETHFEERQVPHSTALQSVRIPGNRPYFVGPLARLNLNVDRLMPQARRLAAEVGMDRPCMNLYHSILARGIETAHAFEESLAIIHDYVEPDEARMPYTYRSGVGMAATEAPRGLIFHRYAIDDQGRVEFAKIVPPTSQNQLQMEEDLRLYLPRVMNQDDGMAALACEKLLRNYDPCISCSTHFLKLTVIR